jgi:hypothetical protein
MAYLNDRVYDNGLSALTSEVTMLYLCDTEPTTYVQASSTYALGSAASPTVGSPEAGSPNGRQVPISAISNGNVTANGTAGFWALCDVSNTRLLAAHSLTSPQVVTSGNTFTLTAFTIRIPSPA